MGLNMALNPVLETKLESIKALREVIDSQNFLRDRQAESQ